MATPKTRPELTPDPDPEPTPDLTPAIVHRERAVAAIARLRANLARYEGILANSNPSQDAVWLEEFRNTSAGWVGKLSKDYATAMVFLGRYLSRLGG